MVAAATQAMGLPTGLPNLRLHCADAAAFLRERLQQQQGQQWRQQADAPQADAQQGRLGSEQPYDLVCMDAFDGEDNVPAALCTPGALCGMLQRQRQRR